MRLLRDIVVGAIALLGVCQILHSANLPVYPHSTKQHAQYSTAIHGQLSSLWARPAGTGGDVSFTSLSSFVRTARLTSYSANTQGQLNSRLLKTEFSAYTATDRAVLRRQATFKGISADQINAAGIRVTSGGVIAVGNTYMNDGFFASTYGQIDNTLTALKIKHKPTGILANVSTLTALPGNIPQACVTVFDGAPGANALFCNISGNGITSLTYGADGSSPQPVSLGSFILKIYEGAKEVVAQTISWWTGGSSNRIFGTGSTRSFTPSIKPLFSHLSSNNQIFVMASYSSPYGKRFCRTFLPIAVTKIGTTGAQGGQGEQGIQGVQGIQGPPGDSPTITKSAVLAEFIMSNPGGTSLTVRPNTATGQTNSTAMVTVGDTQGYRRTELSATSVTTYHSDGNTKTFSIYSGVLTIW